MAFGAGWFTWINATLASIIHVIIFLIAVWYMTKAKKNNNLMWAFLVLALGQLFFAFVHWGWMDNYTVHIIETVFVLVAVLLVGAEYTKMMKK